MTAREIFERLRHRAWARALALHLALLLAAVLVAALVALLIGRGPTALGILAAYFLASVALSWRAMPGAGRSDREADAEQAALQAFASEPLGQAIGESVEQLAGARRAVGREAPMYRPLDRLVKAARKVERRLALEEDLRRALGRAMRRELPLIASTATQYVRLQHDVVAGAQPERLIAAEAALRDAADRLEALSRDAAAVEEPWVGMLRLDVEAEVLAEHVSTDIAQSARRALHLRAAHSLQLAAKTAPEDLAGALAEAARRVERDAGAAAGATATFVERDVPQILAALSVDPVDLDGLRRRLDTFIEHEKNKEAVFAQ